MSPSRDRIDVLGPGAPHLDALRPGHLDRTLDPELQALVAHASEALDAPIGLVSLVLERVQFFRAHHGLDGDLARTRATDRDVSFCQFVVRDQDLLQLDDVANDDRVPQHIVKRYGVRAYLGAPVRVGGVVVGSFCVMDSRPRTFTADDRACLEALAARAGARLDALEQERARRRLALMESAMVPAFPGLRNLLTPVLGNVRAAGMAVASIAPVMAMVDRLADENPGRLSELATARQAFEDLAEMIQDLDEASVRLSHAVLALEPIVLPTDEQVPLVRVFGLARSLVEPSLARATVELESPADGPGLAMDAGAAVSLLSSALGAGAQLAIPGAGALHVKDAGAVEGVHTLSFRFVDLDAAALTALRDSLARLVQDDAAVDLVHHASGFDLRFVLTG